MFNSLQLVNLILLIYKYIINSSREKQRENYCIILLLLYRVIIVLTLSLFQAQTFQGDLQDMLQRLGEIDGQLSTARAVGGLPETAKEQLERFNVRYLTSATSFFRGLNLMSTFISLVKEHMTFITFITLII